MPVCGRVVKSGNSGPVLRIFPQTLFCTLSLIGREVIFICKKLEAMYGYDAAKQAVWNVTYYVPSMTLERMISHYRFDFYRRMVQIWNFKYREKSPEFMTLRTEILKSKVFYIEVTNANEFDISDGKIKILSQHVRNHIYLFLDNCISNITEPINMNLSHTIEFLENLHEIAAQLDKDAYDWALDQYKEWRIKEILSQQ